MKPKKINLDDWYTTDQARRRLSANSGREIDASYPRTLARYGNIRSLQISDRANLYFKADVDAYIVSSQRGRKPKEPRKKEETQQCENCGRESDDLEECEDCHKLCCELCIAGQYQGFSYWDGNVDFTMKCAECGGWTPALAAV